MDGANGNPTILEQAAFDTILTPLDEYGCGIEIVNTKFGPLLWHNGSNGYFYALMYMVPDHDVSVAVMVNAGSDDVIVPVHLAVDSVTAKELAGD
jgi:hypothetical protein